MDVFISSDFEKEFDQYLRNILEKNSVCLETPRFHGWRHTPKAKVILSERITVKLKGLWGVYSGILKNGFRSCIFNFLYLFCSSGILVIITDRIEVRIP